MGMKVLLGKLRYIEDECSIELKTKKRKEAAKKIAHRAKNGEGQHQHVPGAGVHGLPGHVIYAAWHFDT